MFWIWAFELWRATCTTQSGGGCACVAGFESNTCGKLDVCVDLFRRIDFRWLSRTDVPTVVVVTTQQVECWGDCWSLRQYGQYGLEICILFEFLDSGWVWRFLSWEAALLSYLCCTMGFGNSVLELIALLTTTGSTTTRALTYVLDDCRPTVERCWHYNHDSVPRLGRLEDIAW